MTNSKPRRYGSPTISSEGHADTVEQGYKLHRVPMTKNTWKDLMKDDVKQLTSDKSFKADKGIRGLRPLKAYQTQND